MATIYCSTKLSTLMGLPKKPKDHLTTAADPHSWNAQLFYLNKRKCLLLMHKASLYSFLALDIVKKDLYDFPSFFRQGLTDQLLADQLISPKTKAILDSAYDSITLLPTDNDKKVLGSMNNHILTIRYYDARGGDALTLRATYIGHQLNRTPMKPIGYAYSVEKMNEFLVNQIV
jgi:hypothetical protein